MFIFTALHSLDTSNQLYTSSHLSGVGGVTLVSLSTVIGCLCLRHHLGQPIAGA